MPPSGLYCRLAGDGVQYFVARALGRDPAALAQPLAYLLKRGCGLGNVNVVRHRAHGKALLAERLDLKAHLVQKRGVFLDYLRVLGRRADDDRRKQRLAHYLPVRRRSPQGCRYPAPRRSLGRPER